MTEGSTKRNVNTPSSPRSEFLKDVLAGLTADQKNLNPKYFYDAVGSRLFEQITQLPEYYITRTETKMMHDIAADIEHHCSKTQAIVEFGSGSGQRCDLLLSGLPNVTQYVPIDVSEGLLSATSAVVERTHPGVSVIPVVADFTQKMQLPDEIAQSKLGYFPGSTIGNFLPDEAASFLNNAKNVLGRQSRMLVGVDLMKAPEQLELAYDDAEGVTAQFNKNVLARINQELGADFLLDNFEHQAFFDQSLSRIEMHLVSLKNQTVTIGGQCAVNFRVDETIHTENSHKYTVEGFHHLASKSGWSPVMHWVDNEGLFSVHLLESGSR